MSELGGDGGGLEHPAVVVDVVVVLMKVLLAHQQLVEDARRSVHIHVESKQPLPQSLSVDVWEPVEGDVRTFCGHTVVYATLGEHLFVCTDVSGTQKRKK